MRIHPLPVLSALLAVGTVLYLVRPFCELIARLSVLFPPVLP